MRRIAILTHAHCSLFELGCAVELFALPRPEIAHWYACDVVNLEGAPFESTAGVTIAAKCVTSLSDYDTLVIPSWPTQGDPVPEVLAREVRAFAQAGKRLLSFCSGAFLLAELGLLDGRQATTHWRYAERFKARFAQVDYVDDVLYVWQDPIGCSAGSAAALDLGLAVIRHDFGYKVANQVARRLVMSAHRAGGQSQFVEAPMLAVPNQFAGALDWAQQHLTSPINVDQLAARANMSRRTFERKFRASFNLSPNEWLIQQKIERAKGLLEETTLPLERLAEQSGFDSVVTLRHHFRRLLGVSPKQYQQQFLP
ncbi:helix-turn-helix domain-containing protein [Vibrio furnissii]|uniref:helix-turn-helix domain-containing protein n=1 Tax=Vibrio furnissii TaxID=29494 RepID=UPI000200D809|nr:helix-turn-helix domain-containing protein [Vibrio furnissii]ADT89137.1 transcriptional regulator araC family protein [Vibrio furnissii NCTC 11218]